MHRQSSLWALESHLSGFEASMQLFDSVEEKRQAWWAAERVAQSIAREIEASLEKEIEMERQAEAEAEADGEDVGQGNVALRDQLDEVHAIATLCRSSRKVITTPSFGTTSYSASCFAPSLTALPPFVFQLASLAAGSVATAPKFSSPFLAELAISPHDAARGRFRQHFEWLNVLRHRRDEPELVSFEAYEAAEQVRIPPFGLARYDYR